MIRPPRSFYIATLEPTSCRRACISVALAVVRWCRARWSRVDIERSGSRRDRRRTLAVRLSRWPGRLDTSTDFCLLGCAKGIKVMVETEMVMVKKLNWEKFACSNFEWFFTYRTEADATKIRSQCTQSSLRRPVSDLHCSWTSKELRLRIVVDRKLRSCRQSFRWAVSTAVDIESLQMMGEWWKFIASANLFLLFVQLFLSHCFTTQLRFTEKW